MRDDSEYRTVKIVVLGDARVGKTSLMTRWVTGLFSDEHKETIGSSIYVKRVTQPVDTKFQFWDTAGAERFASLKPMYIREAEMALVLWDDSTDRVTFNSIRGHLEQLKANEPNIPILFIRTKADIGSKDWADDKAGIEKLAAEFGIQHFSILNTSAKTGLNCSNKAIIPEIHKLLSAQNISLAPAASAVSPVAAENKPAYEPSRFAHSRKIRFSFLEEMFKDKNPKELSQHDLAWLFVHWVSVDDRKSKTSLWIEKQIAARVGAYDPGVETYDDSHKARFENIMNVLPFMASGSVQCKIYLRPTHDLSKIFPKIASIPPTGTFAHFQATDDLLRLLSKRETSFKYKFTFFESSLAIAHQEMKLILDIAKRMHDRAFDGVKLNQEEDGDNKAARPSLRELFLKDILEDKQISPEVESILSEWENQILYSIACKRSGGSTREILASERVDVVSPQEGHNDNNEAPKEDAKLMEPSVISSKNGKETDEDDPELWLGPSVRNKF